VRLLLIEDNPGDVGLIREALAPAGSELELAVARDGLEALALLERCEAAARPDLILLDLNLPRMDGRELLARLKAHPELRRIPVVVLTSSSAPQDVRRAYDLHANCYLVKPTDFSGLERAVRGIADFWLGIVRLPDR
jgi:CheY-like chemotaxis protein